MRQFRSYFSRHSVFIACTVIRLTSSDMKFEIYCIAAYATLLHICVANTAFRDGEACLIQYLQKKGKLGNDFKSIEQPSPNCLFVMPLTKMVLRKTFTDRIEKEIPKHSDCLTTKFDSQETLDLIIEISVVQEIDNVKIELEPIQRALHDDLKNIMSHCETKDETFIAIFNDYLGFKNETLEVLQQDYCLAKFVADNKIVDLSNVELNPGKIDIENLNCNQMVDKLRNDSEKELTDKILSLPNGQDILRCVMDAYKMGGIFDAGIALKVLYNLDVPKELKQPEHDRLTQKLSGFGLATFSCT